jgi:hypothetical protein
MLDELKTEERLRHDPDSNKIQGVCCEHGHKTSLEFNSEKEVDLLLEAIDKKDIHLTVKVSDKSMTAIDALIFVGTFSQLNLGNCQSTWHVE